MITYDPLWKTLKEKKISTYKLEKEYGMSKSMIHKLRNNKNVTLETVEQLCTMLECELWDILEYKPNKK